MPLTTPKPTETAPHEYPPRTASQVAEFPQRGTLKAASRNLTNLDRETVTLRRGNPSFGTPLPLPLIWSAGPCLGIRGTLE